METLLHFSHRNISKIFKHIVMQESVGVTEILDLLLLLFGCYFPLNKQLFSHTFLASQVASIDKDGKPDYLAWSNHDNADLLLARPDLSPEQNNLIFLPAESVCRPC